MGWVVNAKPQPLYPRKETRYLLYRRLGGSQGRSRWVRKIWHPPGFDLRMYIHNSLSADEEKLRRMIHDATMLTQEGGTDKRLLQYNNFKEGVERTYQ
jgi:hypothetical protein